MNVQEKLTEEYTVPIVVQKWKKEGETRYSLHLNKGNEVPFSERYRRVTRETWCMSEGIAQTYYVTQSVFEEIKKKIEAVEDYGGTGVWKEKDFSIPCMNQEGIHLTL